MAYCLFQLWRIPVVHNPSNDDVAKSAQPQGNRIKDEFAKYTVGQVIHHTLFDYRGVIVDVDPQFRIGAQMKAQEKRPKFRSDDTRPWYHVLVDGTANRAYVSEQNLEPDFEGGPVDHPDVIDYFDDLSEGVYVSHPHKVH